MKHIYFLIAILSAGVLAGCGSSSDRGEVVGVPAKSFRAEVPYGMIYVPSGSFLMGQTDQDVTFAQIAQTKQVTIPAFFMDQTEITNSQYRQFVNWVRDSIAILNY
jgi:sulfatase modifying factor 1